MQYTETTRLDMFPVCNHRGEQCSPLLLCLRLVVLMGVVTTCSSSCRIAELYRPLRTGTTYWAPVCHFGLLVGQKVVFQFGPTGLEEVTQQQFNGDPSMGKIRELGRLPHLTEKECLIRLGPMHNLSGRRWRVQGPYQKLLILYKAAGLQDGVDLALAQQVHVLWLMSVSLISWIRLTLSCTNC